MKFMKLLIGCFKNTVFISSHEVVRKLSTMPLVTQHTTSVLSGDNTLIIKGNQGNLNNLLELFYSETGKPKLMFLKQSSLKQALNRSPPIIF